MRRERLRRFPRYDTTPLVARIRYADEPALMGAASLGEPRRFCQRATAQVRSASITTLSERPASVST